MGSVLSVNVGVARPIEAKSGTSGIDKRAVSGRVEVHIPGPRAGDGGGLAGDAVCDAKHHGGNDQAVYAYAREDLDWWERDLDGPIRSGLFGENLTTSEVDVTGAEIGEVWQVGPEVVLQVTCPRIPCSTFHAQMQRPGWVKRFTRRGVSGAYLRVVSAGSLAAGDPIEVVDVPGHGVTIGMLFRALTTEPDLLARCLAAGPYLTDEARRRAERGEHFELLS